MEYLHTEGQEVSSDIRCELFGKTDAGEVRKISMAEGLFCLFGGAT